ncbi:MAG TPA: PRD domain-containing protein [Candidatus Dormibacteraeota bacterium]|nr:PRD domain-containing protein [Candidatus Dormibacteraeota bacterium]
MTELPLDSRQASIARALLKGPRVVSVEAIASTLHLTDRMVRYELPAIEAYLAERGLRLGKRRGVGVWIDDHGADRGHVLEELMRAPGPVVLDPDERQSIVLLALLEAAPDPLRSGELEARLGVSRPTVRRDVRVAEAWLEQHRLHLRRLPGVGIGVRGSEVDVRAALLALILERIPVEALAGSANGAATAATGLGAFVAALDLDAFRQVLAAELPDVDDREPTLLTATVSLAILTRRVWADRPARLVRGRLRSLLDHPASEDARRIASAVTRRSGVVLGSTEVAAITESLLGFVELGDQSATPQAAIVQAVDRLVGAAGSRLNPLLATDELLRANLTEHIRRLAVRLRYGLPVSNPLQGEVRKRYPDVYEVAASILASIATLDGVAIPAEETGFLTMYLAGSLERLRLRPKIRITVVCPAGMATVWILVSRLLSEFPQVEVSQVVSKTAYERAPASISSDYIVSTVPLEVVPDVPTLIVNPLLQEGDVRRLARMLGLPPQH